MTDSQVLYDVIGCSCVLVVDDDSDLRGLMRTWIEKAGAEVQTPPMGRTRSALSNCNG